MVPELALDAFGAGVVVRPVADVVGPAADLRRRAPRRPRPPGARRDGRRAARAAHGPLGRASPRSGLWSDSGPRRAPRRRRSAGRPGDHHVVDVVAGDVRQARHRRPRRVEVAAEHERAAARPVERRRRREEAGRRGAARRGCVEPCRFVTQPPPRSATPCITRRSGARVSSRSRCSAIAPPRTRIALQPPPLALSRSGLRAAIARRSAQQRVARRQRAARARAGRARRAARGHHGGTSCSSATSHDQPASARANSRQQRAARRRLRAAVEEVPGQDEDARRYRTRTARRSATARARRAVHCRACRATSSPAPSCRAAELAALLDRALELKAEPLASRVLAGPQRRARLRAAVDAHAHVVRGRDRRARRPPDGAAPRRAAAHARRVGARHRARALAPRRGDRPAHRVGGDARRAGRARDRARRQHALARPPPVPGARRPAHAARGVRRRSPAAGSPTSATATTSRARSRSSARSPASRSRSPRPTATSSRTARARALTDDPAAGRRRRRRALHRRLGLDERRRGDGRRAPRRARARTGSTTRCSTAPRPARSRCTACPRTRARRSPPRCSTASASGSGTRPRTAATRRRRCSSCCSGRVGSRAWRSHATRSTWS